MKLCLEYQESIGDFCAGIQGQTVGVDVSAVAHHLLIDAVDSEDIPAKPNDMWQGHQSHTINDLRLAQSCAGWIFSLQSKHGVVPLIIFGGPDPAAKARGPARAQRDRAQQKALQKYRLNPSPSLFRRAFRWTSRFEVELKHIMNRAGYRWIQSPQEADHELIHLYRIKVIAAAVANEVDLVLFVIPVIDLITGP